MSTRSTYVWIGRTNPYQAQAGRHYGFFKGRTLAASWETHYLTAGEAAEKLMNHAEEDSGTFRDEETGILNAGSFDEVMPGQLRYHHDGYHWELCPLEKLSEENAKVVLRDTAWLNDDDKELIYDNHPDLRPEQVAQDEQP